MEGIDRPTQTQRVIGLHATALALTETGFGNTLRSLHIPFSGAILSLNQIFLITRALALIPSKERSLYPLSISSSAMLFKGLFPQDKILLPSCALCVQGLLYNIGILVLGNTICGRLIGGVLSALWSVLQPLLLALLFFGNISLMPPGTISFLQQIVLSLFGIKVVLSTLIVLIAPHVPFSYFEKYFSFISKNRRRQQVRQPVVGAFSDMCRPLFLISYTLTGTLLFISNGLSERFFFGILSPLVCAFVFFLTIRLLPLQQYLEKQTGLLGLIASTSHMLSPNKLKNRDFDNADCGRFESEIPRPLKGIRL